MTQRDSKGFCNGYSPVTLASPIGYNDLIGDGVDHFWKLGCSTRILQHPSASKKFSLQGAQYIRKPTFLVFMFSQHMTLYGPWIIKTGCIICPTYINLWHVWTNWFCADLDMILKGFHAHKRLFTAKHGHSRKLHSISRFFTVYSWHRFNLTWLQRVAMLLFPHIWARNIVSQSRLSKTRRYPIINPVMKYIYIIKLWTFNIELPPRLYRCRWRIACIVAIVTKAPINSNCFAGLSRGAGLFLSNFLYFDMLWH